MAYDKSTDLENVQADVLTTDTSSNTKISKLKQLKTENKTVTKAINALNDQLGNAQASASDALQSVVNMDQRVTAVETDLADVKTDVATMRSNGAQVQSGNQSLTPMGTITTEQNTNLTIQLLRLLGKDILKYESTSGEYHKAPVVDGKLVISTGEDIKNYVPTQVNNVEFTNVTTPETKLDLLWNLNDVDTSTPGDYITTATYPQGYCSTIGAFPYINVHVKSVAAGNVYGMTVVGPNGTTGRGKWMRVNADGEAMPFDASVHNTWTGLHEVTSDGQPMVEIPTTWVKRGTLENGVYAGNPCWWISDHEIEGFHVHPAFLKRDGSVGNLRIAKYLCSKGDDDVPYVVDQGEKSFSAYWGKAAVTDLDTYAIKRNTGTGEQANWRPMTVYDMHFLGWMMMTELGEAGVCKQVINGKKCDGTVRFDYHGIVDPFGLLNNCMCWVYGITTTNGTIHVLRNDGSMEMVDTGLSVSTNTGTLYLGIPRTESGDGYDFNDLFVLAKSDYMATSVSQGRFGAFQGINKDYAFVVTFASTSSQISPFTLSKYTVTTLNSSIYWRLAQVV